MKNFYTEETAEIVGSMSHLPNRPLSSHEKFFLLGNITVHYTVSGEGVIDTKAMQAAVAEWEKRYPLVQGVARFSLNPDSRVPIVELVFPNNATTQQHTMFFSYNTTYDPHKVAAPMVMLQENRLYAVELYYTDEPEPTYTLALYMRHTVSDAKNGIALLDLLWKLYTEYVSQGEFSAHEPLAIPDTCEDIIADRGITNIPEYNQEVFFSAPPLYTIPEPLPSTITVNAPSRIQLTEDETAALKSCSKKHGLTINSIISAAIVIAEFDFLHSTGRDDTRLVMNTEVNLRSHVTPPVGDLQITNFLGNTVYAADKSVLDQTDGDSSIIEAIKQYGIDIKHKLDNDIASKEVFSLTRRVADPATVIKQLDLPQPPTIPITHTNWGIIPDFSAPSGVVHRDFRGWNIVAPYITTSSLLGVATAIVYKTMIFTTTFRGRLSIDIIQQSPFYPEHTGEFIVERIRAIINEWLQQ